MWVKVAVVGIECLLSVYIYIYIYIMELDYSEAYNCFCLQLFS
jgi:hypothetical protein